MDSNTTQPSGLPIVGVLGNDAAWGQMMRPQAMLYGEDRWVAVD